jgi:DNA end-binding protein Ku
MVWHDKETLVLIRPYEGGLVLQIMYYGNEIRDFDQIAKGENLRLTSEEMELGRGLIDKLSSEDFEPEAYENERRNRVMAMIEEKVKGREITVAPHSAAPRVVIDLMTALKESMKAAQRGAKRADRKKRAQHKKEAESVRARPLNRQVKGACEYAYAGFIISKARSKSRNALRI